MRKIKLKNPGVLNLFRVECLKLAGLSCFLMSLVFSLFFTNQVNAFDKYEEKMHFNVFYGITYHDKSIKRYFGESSVDQLGISFDYPHFYFSFHGHISYIGEATLGDLNQYYKLSELRTGIRKYVYPNTKTSVFFGLGISATWGRVFARSGSPLLVGYQGNSSCKTDVGTYIELGGHYQMTNWWHVGAKVDYSNTRVKFFGKSANVGGVTPSLYTGVSF